MKLKHLLMLSVVVLLGAGCRPAQAMMIPPARHGWDQYRIAWHPHFPVLATSCGIVGVDTDTRILRPWRAEPPAFRAPGTFAGCDWTPDGSHLIASRFVHSEGEAGRWELVSIDVETGDVRSLSDERDGRDSVCPRCSPHGDMVAFFSLKPYAQEPLPARGRLALVPLSGGHIRLLTEEREVSYLRDSVLWAPSGDRLAAYGAFVQTQRAIISLPDGAVHSLSDPTPRGGWPCAWRSDDTLLWLGPSDDGAMRQSLFSDDLHIGAARVLLRAAERVGLPTAVSPRGDGVVCEVTREGEPDRLVHYEVSSGHRSVLLSLPRGGSKGTPRLEGVPSWSPDGEQIAYWMSKGYETQPHELWVVRRDGTHNRRVFP